MNGAVDFSETFNRVSGVVFPVSRYLAGHTGGCIQLFVGNLVKGPGGEDKVGCTVRNQPGGRNLGTSACYHRGK